MTEPSDYYYRLDGVAALRRQRRSDQVLRARRSAADETFAHEQVRAAEASRVGDGTAIYRICFWKSWDAMRMRLWSASFGNPQVIQRVRRDHPAFAAFERGDDEYLPNEAWLFWAEMPVDDERPGWSQIGIPHEDIEVLHPDGRWLPMSEVPPLNDIAEADCATYWVSYGGIRTPRHVMIKRNPAGEQIVLIRQSEGQWETFFKHPTRHSGIVHMIGNWHLEGAEPFKARWFYALETHDRVMVEEIYPLFEKDWARGFRGLFARLRGKQPLWRVMIDEGTDTLPKAMVASLYADLGLEHLLVRGEMWQYPSLLPAIPEMEALRAHFDAADAGAT